MGRWISWDDILVEITISLFPSKSSLPPYSLFFRVSLHVALPRCIDTNPFFYFFSLSLADSRPRPIQPVA